MKLHEIMFVTEKHIALIKLRKEGYTYPEIAVLVDASLDSVIRWKSILKQMYGPLPHPYSGLTISLPCEICSVGVLFLPSELKNRQKIRCKKHATPRVWLNPDTPAWTTQAERNRYLYHHSPKRHAASSRHTLEWVRKKMLADPEWKERYRQYQRDYYRKKVEAKKRANKP